MPTKIEWCVNPDGSQGETWNPITGCTPASTGCVNCYAEAMAKRFWGSRKFSDVHFHAEKLKIPLKWKKTRMVFVCSMSDVMHGAVPCLAIDMIFETIKKCPHHTFVFLTKRIERWKKEYMGDALPNVWLGVTAENQTCWDERVPILRSIPAAKHFVSVEPMLSQISCGDHFYESGIDWVICGAENGPFARHMDAGWARLLYRQCKAANIPFFLKGVSSPGDCAELPRQFPAGYMEDANA